MFLNDDAYDDAFLFPLFAFPPHYSMDDKKPEDAEDFSKGPLSVLWHSVKNNTQVKIDR